MAPHVRCKTDLMRQNSDSEMTWFCHPGIKSYLDRQSGLETPLYGAERKGVSGGGHSCVGHNQLNSKSVPICGMSASFKLKPLSPLSFKTPLYCPAIRTSVRASAREIATPVVCKDGICRFPPKKPLLWCAPDY
jgi:hypothetical protein